MIWWVKISIINIPHRSFLILYLLQIYFTVFCKREDCMISDWLYVFPFSFHSYFKRNERDYRYNLYLKREMSGYLLYYTEALISLMVLSEFFSPSVSGSLTYSKQMNSLCSRRHSIEDYVRVSFFTTFPATGNEMKYS